MLPRKNTYFVDLFVRVSNKVAINMYTNLGYIVYRTIIDYYSGDNEEDAYGEIENTGYYDLHINFIQLQTCGRPCPATRTKPR